MQMLTEFADFLPMVVDEKYIYMTNGKVYTHEGNIYSHSGA